MSRACLKIAFYQMCFPICGRFVPNERGVAGYVDRIWCKYAAKWGTQMVGMNFQTRSRKKYSKEFKLKVLREHDEGASFYSLEKKYNITLGTVKRWNCAFRAHGKDILEHQNSNLCRYTAEFKKKVVMDYLSGGGSGQSVAVKYDIHAQSTVLKWVTQYNSHVE